MKYSIGQPVRRVEDKRFITGRGKYVDDLRFPGQAYGAVLFSPHAHANILSVDVSAAMASQGVLLVLTGADVVAQNIGGLPPLFMPEDAGGPPGYRTSRPILCSNKVRHVGDRVAFVVADTAAQARDAAELIEVEYETLDAVISVEDAVREGAPNIWPACPDNVSVRLRFGDDIATEAVIAQAPRVVTLRLENNRLSPNPMEPRCAIGIYEPADENYILYTTSQNPHGARHMISQSVLRIPEAKLRAIAPDVGGGFGMKTDPYPEDALVLWAARLCGRPVKYLASRSDSFLGDTHGRDQVVTGELAFDDTGRMLGIRARAIHAVGAYVASAAMAPPNFSLTLIPNVYDVQTVDLTTQVVFTNTAPLGVYRGAGRPEATYLIERLVDKAAAQLGLDPAEFRRRNLIDPSQLPYRTATHYIYDSGRFEELMDDCLARADWAGFAERKIQSSQRGRWRGRAITYYIEQAGIFNDRMELRFDPTGNVTIVAGTHSHGQGHATVFTQLVSEWLGLPFEKVNFLQGDTATVPFGRGTYAARSSMIGGSALRVAAEQVIEKCKPMAAFLLGDEEADISFMEGVFSILGTNRSIGIANVVSAFYAPAGIPDKFGVGLGAVGSWSAQLPNFPNGCHICEIEIDRETAVPTIDRYFVVDDTGRALNPMICEGQILGGLAQGIGQALLENIVYDPDTGQLITGSFTDYCMPRADDLPDFQLSFHDVPSPSNPLGVKGVGESGAIAAPPTIINAILDALREVGVEHIDMPATPARIWAAVQNAQAA